MDVFLKNMYFFQIDVNTTFNVNLTDLFLNTAVHKSYNILGYKHNLSIWAGVK